MQGINKHFILCAFQNMFFLAQTKSDSISFLLAVRIISKTATPIGFEFWQYILISQKKCLKLGPRVGG